MNRETIPLQDKTTEDRATTLRNRVHLSANRNLLFWYRELYRDQFKDLPDPTALSILEIGSGTSPLKQFYPTVVTSDVMNLEYLDLVFDCHHIDKLDAIEENSLDVITLTNVLHHLKNPIAFLNSAADKLKHGGKVIATEPFFSLVSTSRRDWLQRLNESFDVANLSARPFSSLSYMATGGISHKLPVPHFLYRALLPVDLAFSRCFPHVCAAFFTLTLTRR